MSLNNYIFSDIAKYRHNWSTIDAIGIKKGKFYCTEYEYVIVILTPIKCIHDQLQSTEVFCLSSNTWDL